MITWCSKNPVGDLPLSGANCVGTSHSLLDNFFGTEDKIVCFIGLRRFSGVSIVKKKKKTILNALAFFINGKYQT